MLGWFRFIADPPSTPRGVVKRAKAPKHGVYYDSDWARSGPAKAVRRFGVYTFFKPAIRLFGSPRVVGDDRLADVEAPVIFAANHHSHADTTLLLATIPGHLRRDMLVLAGADYFFGNRFTSALSALFIGAIPIERKKLSRLSIDNAVEALESGNNLLIYPEGGRSPDGWSQEHRPGAAFVAKRTDTPVVPIYLDGTGSILPKGKNWPTRARCAVVFGAPMTMGDNEDAKAFAARIESRVHELAEEFTSGWWVSRKKAGAGKTPDINGPTSGAWRRRWALGQKPGAHKRKSPNDVRWPKV